MFLDREIPLHTGYGANSGESGLQQPRRPLNSGESPDQRKNVDHQES